MQTQANQPIDYSQHTEYGVCQCYRCILKDADLSIITDLSLGSSASYDVPCYYVGWHTELGAGIWGGSVSPIFLTVQEVEAWILAHEKELRSVSGCAN